MLAILRCFWTDRAIWVKSFVTLKLFDALDTLAKRAARSAASMDYSRFIAMPPSFPIYCAGRPEASKDVHKQKSRILMCIARYPKGTKFGCFLL